MTDLIKSFSSYAEEIGRISREREKEKKSRCVDYVRDAWRL